MTTSDAEYEAAIEHIRWWNESCRKADEGRGRKGKDIGRAAMLEHIEAHRLDVRNLMRCCRWAPEWAEGR